MKRDQAGHLRWKEEATLYPPSRQQDPGILSRPNPTGTATAGRRGTSPEYGAPKSSRPPPRTVVVPQALGLSTMGSPPAASRHRAPPDRISPPWRAKSRCAAPYRSPHRRHSHAVVVLGSRTIPPPTNTDPRRAPSREDKEEYPRHRRC
jgi:hypothetical protein